VIAFAEGCSYRRRLEEWLTTLGVVPARFLELQSYHAIVACVAAGSGVAIIPKSVLEVVGHRDEVQVQSLPSSVARTWTRIVWRSGYRSLALDAFCGQFSRASRMVQTP
jgi:DNA-binding transcriptional LysR family regulator